MTDTGKSGMNQEVVLVIFLFIFHQEAIPIVQSIMSDTNNCHTI
jgi:hypothetical protein